MSVKASSGSDVCTGTHKAPAPEDGNIQLILGPMFSGKSTELLRRLRRYMQHQMCLLIAYKGDTRYTSSPCVTTHDQVEMEATAVEALRDADNAASTFSVIGVDEGQFYPDVAEYAERWANDGKVVIIAALDGTFQRRPFNAILQLIPLAEEVIKLRAVCACRREAAFTHRLGLEQDVEVVGGAENYVAACRPCYRVLTDAKTAASAAAKPGRFGAVNQKLQQAARSARQAAGLQQQAKQAEQDSPATEGERQERRLSVLSLR